MPTAPLTLLDCTLRDGGYYNAWDFSRPLVERYLRAVDSAGVDVVEIGFRAMRGDGFHGPYAFSTDEHIRSLPSLHHARLCVMINAKDILSRCDFGAAAALRSIFSPRAMSPVSLVRIAAHADEVPRCAGMCVALHELGYEVGFNIMQAGEKSADQLRSLAAEIESWGRVSVLYFADSLGSMTPASVRATIDALRGGWSGEIGFHAHDNCNAALANALAAHEAGASWIDGTVLGMGRGAGNAQIEYLLAEFERRGHERFRPEAMLDVLFGGFDELKLKHKWGPNLLYFMGAARGVHPTYVQQMLGADRYSPDDVENALRALGDAGGSSYSKGSLDTAVVSRFTKEVGAWSAPRMRKDSAGVRTALLLASTPGLTRHAGAVESLARRLRPTVFALNERGVIDSELIDYLIASHPTRVVNLARRAATEAIPFPANATHSLAQAAGAESISPHRGAAPRPRPRLITPLASLTEETLGALGAKFEVCDFGLRVAPDSFAVQSSGCVAPNPGVGPYSLAAAAACGAERILLAGFDGHGPGDERTRAMNSAIEMFQRECPGVELIAITPSEYAVEQGSVYDDTLLA